MSMGLFLFCILVYWYPFFFKIPCISDILRYLSFSVWLSTLSRIISRLSMLLQMTLFPKLVFLTLYQRSNQRARQETKNKCVGCMLNGRAPRRILAFCLLLLPQTNFQILKHYVGWRELLCSTWTVSTEVGSWGDLAGPACKHRLSAHLPGKPIGGKLMCFTLLCIKLKVVVFYKKPSHLNISHLDRKTRQHKDNHRIMSLVAT